MVVVLGDTYSIDDKADTSLLNVKENICSDIFVKTDRLAGEPPAHHSGHIARLLELEPSRGERQTDQHHPGVQRGRAGQPDEPDVIVDCLRLPAIVRIFQS